MAHMPPPLAAHNLVQEFYGRPPREMYATFCTHFSVRENTELAKGLPQDAQQLSALDLSTNLIGVRGIKPVMSLVAACPNLHTVILRDNHLNNAAVNTLVDMLDGVRHLRVLDLSSNPFITGTVVRALADFLRMNPNVEELHVERTGISVAQQRSLERLVLSNSSLSPTERTLKFQQADERRHIKSTTSPVEKRRVPDSPLFFPTHNGVVPLSVVFQIASDSRALLEATATAPPSSPVVPRVYAGLELLASACAPKAT
jgi:hypothetical protein